MDLTVAKRKYTSHKGTAKFRSIPFEITFDEWCDVWQQSGQWENRGKGLGQYCMSRKGDAGPYSADNVFIQLTSKNMSEGNLGKSKPKSDEFRIKLSITNTGRTLSAAHCANISAAQLGKKRGTYNKKEKQ